MSQRPTQAPGGHLGDPATSRLGSAAARWSKKLLGALSLRVLRVESTRKKEAELSSPAKVGLLEPSKTAVSFQRCKKDSSDVFVLLASQKKAEKDMSS